MTPKEKYEKYQKICQRAVREGLFRGPIITLLMYIVAADKKFQLRLDDWLDADAFNFAHDICGIENNINRNDFPNATFGYFVPRFSGNR